MKTIDLKEPLSSKVENYSKLTGIPVSSVIKLCIQKFFEVEENGKCVE